MFYTALTEYGWQRSGTKLEVIWDTPDNILHADQQVQFILHRCKCRTGCSTRRCKCKKEGRACGPGCQCIHCTNSASTSGLANMNVHELEGEDQSSMCNDDSTTDTSSDEMSDRDDQDDQDGIEDDVNTVMQSVFGDDQ